MKKYLVDVYTPSILNDAYLPGLSCIPIGIEKETLSISYYDFTNSVVNLVLAKNQEWKPFTDELALMVSEHYGIKTIVFAPLGKSSIESNNDKLQIFYDLEGCVKAVRKIWSVILERNNDYYDKLTTADDVPTYEPLFVVIRSMSLLKKMLERYVPAEGEVKEASNDTPLNRLQTAMAKCDKAYNVHFIIAESINDLNPFSVESWYKTHIDGHSCIWIGNGIAEQFRFAISERPAEFRAYIPPDFGFKVANSSATLIRLLHDRRD